MLKRGQTSVFIVVGIIIVLFIFFANQLNNSGSTVLQETNQLSVNSFVTDCLQKTAEDAVYYTSLQGGYYYPMFPSTTFENVDVAWYWDVGDVLVPSIQVIESELASYIIEEIHTCFNGFIELESLGYSIDAPNPYVEVESGLTEIDSNLIFASATLTEHDILFTLNYPVSVVQGQNKFVEDSFSTQISIPLKKYISFISELIDEQKESPDGFLESAFSLSAFQNGFTYEKHVLNKNSVLVGMRFPQENNNPLLYSFILTYDWQDV